MPSINSVHTLRTHGSAYLSECCFPARANIQGAGGALGGPPKCFIMLAMCLSKQFTYTMERFLVAEWFDSPNGLPSRSSTARDPFWKGYKNRHDINKFSNFDCHRKFNFSPAKREDRGSKVLYDNQPVFVTLSAPRTVDSL